MGDTSYPAEGVGAGAADPRATPGHVDAPSPSAHAASSSARTVSERKGTGRVVAGPSGWRNTFSSLKVREFRFLWFGQVAMMGGLQMQMMARGYLVYDLTGKASLLGIVMAGSAIPILALSLFGGAVADRVERKGLVQAGQAVSAVLALLVAVAISTDQIAWYHLLGVSLVQGGIWSFMMPARQAIIPQLVSKEQFTNAVALSAAAMSGTALVAPAIAGGIYALAGPALVYYLIAGLGVIAVVMTSFVPKTGGGTRKPNTPMLEDIADGLSYIRRSSILMVLLMIGLGTVLLAMPFRFLMPVFVVDIYHRGPESMGLLLAVMGGGSLAGTLAVASLGRWKRGLLFILGTFASGIALLLVALLPFYYAAAGIMLLLGLGDAGRRTLNQALIMEQAEDRYRGRVMSVFMMSFGLMPLGVLPVGLMFDWIGGQFAIGILAVLLLVMASVVLATQKQLRYMP